MALGGGRFTTMNKVLPGAYINVTTRPTDSFGLESGVVAIPLCLNWGPDAEVISIAADEWLASPLTTLGYLADADALKAVREIFTGGASRALIYNMNTGAKAACTYANAKYKGTRGNDITIKIAANVDDNTYYDVTTIVDNMDQDVQTVLSAADLVDNDWVAWKTTASLTETAGTALTGGTNGTVTGTQVQAALAALEQKYFNVLVCDSTDSTTKALFVAYVKRMRDQMGKDFQLVIYDNAADYEGVINVVTAVSDSGANVASLVYWVGGKSASCTMGRSNTNAIYTGEFEPVCAETQAQLEAAIKAGKFIFHQVGDDIRVLMDINSLVTYSDEKGELMAKNEVIRVTDYLNNMIAQIFTEKYIGKVINNETGRAHLKQDIAAVQDKLVQQGAIEYDNADITVTQGPDKGDVVITDIITVNAAMVRLYMTIVIG